jgi:ribose/xylose/arabinose/galactoside ABC-type transport system permease subunit
MNIMGVSTTWQQTAIGSIIIFSILLEAVGRYISNRLKVQALFQEKQTA